MTLPLDDSGKKSSVQQVGSSVSYGKRYVMSAMLNITTRAEDDNGLAAAPFKKVTQLQASSISATLDKCSEATKEWFFSTYEDTSSVPRAEFDRLIANLKKAAEKAGEKEA